MAGRTLENLKARYGGSFDPTKEGPRRGPGPGGLSFGKPQNGGEVFRRLMGYIGRYWKRLIAVLLCMLLVQLVREHRRDKTKRSAHS